MKPEYKVDYYGESGQDYFVLSVLKEKRNGTFLEIGTSHPTECNNSYILEKKYNWKGILVEYEKKWELSYKIARPNSIPIMADATTIDYEKVLSDNNFPENIDYLQLDLEVDNQSTMITLEMLELGVMPTRKFAVVTFEHDIYRGDYFNTRKHSREIFERNGYFRVFSDINCPAGVPFEDWYVHPDLVDMDYINKIKDLPHKDHKTLLNFL
jgi:hypothetical protein